MCRNSMLQSRRIVIEPPMRPLAKKYLPRPWASLQSSSRFLDRWSERMVVPIYGDNKNGTFENYIPSLE